MEARPLTRYGEQRKANGITWSKQTTEAKPKPTPRILGRLNGGKRVARPPSSISDTNDADSEQDHAVQRRDNYLQTRSRNQTRAPYAFRPPSSNSEFELLSESPDESHHEAAPVLHGFFASKSAATQRIVLASVFHSWLHMAQAMRARRDDLLHMWAEAIEFRNRRIVTHSLATWRKATEQRTSGRGYEKVQTKLAVMHCRKLYLRRAFSRLLDSWELQQRLNGWEAGAPKRLVVGCWIKWRDHLVCKKNDAILHASNLVQQSARTNALRRALHCWRHQAMLMDKEHMFVQWRSERILKESVRVWRLQHVELGYARRQQKASPIKNSLARWRDAAGALRRERDHEMKDQLMLRQGLLAWHAMSRQMTDMEDQADTLRRRALLYAPLDRLFDGFQARQTANERATRFHRYQTMARAFEIWRQHCRTRRDSQLQSRAIRDLARRRDQKQRRLVLSAWREVAGRVARAESYADELVSRRCRAMLVNCFRKWYASCSFDGIGQHTATVTQFANVPPSLRARPQAPPQLLVPASAPVTDAQTMTSMIEDLPRRERAVSAQVESDDRQELMRRLREAEEEANRYKSLYVDPKQVKMDLVAHEERLEELLGRWNRDHRRRRLQSAFRQMRARSQNGRHYQEQEERQLAAVTRKHSDNRLRQALRQWRGVAQSQRRDAIAADKHYYRLNRPINETLCYNVLFEWRDQLKAKRQLVMSADKRRQVNVARKFLLTLLTRFARQREMELEASSMDRKLVLSRMWDRFTRQFTMTKTSRVLTSMHLSDRDALMAIANVASGNAQDRAPMVSEPNLLDNTAMIEVQELEEYFSAWRMLVEDVRNAQGAIMERLPPLLQQRAVRSLTTTEGFDWGLLHQGHLLSSVIGKWRRLLPAARATRSSAPAPLLRSGPSFGLARGASSEGDGPNAAELQRYEKMVAQGPEFRTKQTAFHRWVIANRGKLLEQRQLSLSMKRLVSAIALRARQVKVAREKERLFQLRPAVNSWRTRYLINATRMDNARVQANGSCVRLCLLHWLSQIRAHPDNGRALYMKAIAFRWEKQTRRALAQWMRASTNDKVRVRLAQRAGRQRESQLLHVADKCSRRRVLGDALRTLRCVARRQKVQHEMSMRLATAWGNANIQRYALSVWRQRMSPSSSMYFSVVESPVYN